MEKIELKIIGISYSQTQSGAYALVLKEIDGNRRIPIIIGAPEAQSIAIELENLKPIRPLTHDLFLSMATSFAVNIVEVNIVKLQDGIFYSEIICEQGGATAKIDSRTSDAIALALRFRCPIYSTPEIVDKAGIVLETKDGKIFRQQKKKNEKPESALLKKNLRQLQEMMDEAIKKEDYELASLIRDEIASRK